ncbi:MAG: hypothetical protein RLZZ399_2992 [Verrucomicrobiota bacterium]|jgi:hypothetical protein
MKLFVLHPGSSSPDQQFPDFAGSPSKTAHEPLGFHGFAACTGGAFVRSASSIPASEKRVLLLLDSNLKRGRQAAIDLRRAGKIVVLAFAQQEAARLSEQFRSPASLELLQDICARAHAAIAPSKDFEPVFRSFGILYVESILPPIPLEEAAWDFSCQPEDRTGIFLGSWDWKMPSRNHLLALLGLREVASQMYEPVTVFNLHGWRGRRWLRNLRYPSGLLRVVERRLPYPDYLRIVAQHKLVFHLDSSGGTGRIATDALLARLPCVGGNGSTERLLFPELNGAGATTPELLQTVSRLLDHGHDRDMAVESALNIANQILSFSRVQQTLEELFHYLG